MLTDELFWGQISAFNKMFESLHYVWIAVSIVLLLWVFVRPCRTGNALLKGFLSATFAFNGIVFFIINGASPVSRFFYGPLFILVGIFLFADIFGNRIAFQFPERKWIRWATILGLVLVYAYPLFGMALGRRFPYLCMPMNACPSTVLATVLVAGTVPYTDRKTLIALLPWGILGLPKALGLYGCYEDSILFAAGVYGLVMAIVFWKKIKR